MTDFRIALLPGDGIGPEVINEATKVLESLGKRFGYSFQFQEAIVGGAAIDKYGVALPDGVLEMCKKSDAVLFGAVGGPKWDDPTSKVRPEQAILGLRKGLQLFANLRPVRVMPFLMDASPLKREVLEGVDLVVIRELTGGLYFGKPQKTWTTSRGRRAVDTMAYSENEIARVVRVGFELARGRKKRLASVDKANVVETSRLWRQVVNEIAPEYPDVQVEHVLVDTAAMRLIQRPSSFDVIVTENMFGDILTDEASVLAGSMGMLTSASLGTRRTRRGTFGMYEPIHGTAPDIAGQSKANPIAAVLSSALMLRYSLGLPREADVIEDAVKRVLNAGYRTVDIAAAGDKIVNTSEMGDLIAAEVAK